MTEYRSFLSLEIWVWAQQCLAAKVSKGLVKHGKAFVYGWGFQLELRRDTTTTARTRHSTLFPVNQPTWIFMAIYCSRVYRSKAHALARTSPDSKIHSVRQQKEEEKTSEHHSTAHWSSQPKRTFRLSLNLTKRRPNCQRKEIFLLTNAFWRQKVKADVLNLTNLDADKDDVDCRLPNWIVENESNYRTK